MPKSCIVCSAVASPDLQLQYCGQCQSALYCSKACQREDWNEQMHRQICKLLNVGHGDRQVRDDDHTSQQIQMKERFEKEERSLDEDMKQFFRLFRESTFEGSQAAARNMRKIAKRLTKQKQRFLLRHSLHSLVCSSNSEMISWPNSPLLVLLQFVDPNVLFGNEETSITLLHHLADLADPSDYSTHKNQLILAKQLVEHGANVNAVSNPCGLTILHSACSPGSVTNLDFVEYLLEEGADPNAISLLMYTVPHAPGAAKFLLNWPTTDAMRSGESFLCSVRLTLTDLSIKVFEHSDRLLQNQFLLLQWNAIEEKLVERGAH